MSYDLLVIAGPTASGKTRLAAMVASQIGGEIIGADSRQVYRSMNIGTGKDYDDYVVEGRRVPVHLIDIADAGTRYNVFQYQRDFLSAYHDISSRGVMPIVCGGSGMYIDSIVRGYRLLPVPVNAELRKRLSGKGLDELRDILEGYKKIHNTTDVDTVKRAVRAIEIAEWYSSRPDDEVSFPELKSIVAAVRYARDERRRRITERLHSRLSEGMIDEVEQLLDSGVEAETLIYYGLEYKFITLYITKEISYSEMVKGLETAIHQFAKRQMTWLRGMERRGTKIHWIEGELPLNDKVEAVKSLLA